MPRPSLKAERRQEILNAIERVVIREGVNGATLEKIAEEAAMRRSLLRHNIGNREQLLTAFLDRFFEKSNTVVQQMLDYLPEQGRMAVLLDYLFDEEYANSQLALVALALTSAAATDTHIRQRLKAWNLDYIATIAKELQRNYPQASAQGCYEVATGLVGIFFNAESLAPLGDMSEVRLASKRAAERLLLSLQQ